MRVSPPSFSCLPHNYYLNYAFDLQMDFSGSGIIFNYAIHGSSVLSETQRRHRWGRSRFAIVTLPGDPSQRFPGKITNPGQEFDPETRMMDVWIALDNPRYFLRLEMLANAEIPPRPGSAASDL